MDNSRLINSRQSKIETWPNTRCCSLHRNCYNNNIRCTWFWVKPSFPETNPVVRLPSRCTPSIELKTPPIELKLMVSVALCSALHTLTHILSEKRTMLKFKFLKSMRHQIVWKQSDFSLFFEDFVQTTDPPIHPADLGLSLKSNEFSLQNHKKIIYLEWSNTVQI